MRPPRPGNIGFVTESGTVYTLWGLRPTTTLSALESRILDLNSEHLGVPVSTLMENAGRAVAEEVARRFPDGAVLVVAGSGNNGGDGLVAARHLSETRPVTVALLGEPKTREAREALRRLEPTQVEVVRESAGPDLLRLARGSGVIVDAVLGVGVSGALRDPARSAVRAINASGRPIVAVDVPTGLGGPLQARAALTVALHDRKPGMTRARCGQVVVHDIGVPEAAATDVGPGDFAAPYPRNAPTSHKGQNGRVLVVAGGPFPGAAVLTARAALRSGVDLVRVVAPRETARVLRVKQPDLIVIEGHDESRLTLLDVALCTPLLSKSDVLLLGPGLGAAADTRRAVLALLRQAARHGTRCVLDADALAVAGTEPGLVRRLRPLATPHAGEFKELTGKGVPRDPAKAERTARQEARRLRATLLLKGSIDVITDGVRLKRNRIHTPAMTTGGTGDVLAGLCAGLVAKGLEPFRAACAAAFLNGEAGRRVAQRQGGTLVASDLVAEIPRVFHAWLGPDMP